MIPLRTLVIVELRKATDTRAARAVFAIIVALGLGAALLTARDEPSFAESISAPLLPLTALLPIVAVLAVTGDWTQRVALTTFALVPRRRRILMARLIACVALVLVTAFVVAALGALSSLILHPGAIAHADPGLVGRNLWGVTALALCAALSGAAIGSLLLNTPAAIAVTLVVPITYDIVLGLNAPSVAPWVSSLAFTTWLSQPNWGWEALPDGVPGIGQAASSLVLWIIVPLAVGWWRQLRREVR
ncbi:hypothetical protein AX769_11440 [Frondihabitans sp. PAMC 28766]|nr:hypothetical protein AX769_11440 [Frondihabitans sp. PAMC 28766]